MKNKPTLITLSKINTPLFLAYGLDTTLGPIFVMAYRSLENRYTKPDINALNRGFIVPFGTSSGGGWRSALQLQGANEADSYSVYIEWNQSTKGIIFYSLLSPDTNACNLSGSSYYWWVLGY